jgi:hypothetical protein
VTMISSSRASLRALVACCANAALE